MTKTPAAKWESNIRTLRKRCQDILKISQNIRYAGVINNYGRTLTGIMRPDLKPLLKSEQVKNEFFIISTLMSLRQDSVESVGRLEHVILQHHKVAIVILHKRNVTYYVSISRKEKNLDKILSMVKKAI